MTSLDLFLYIASAAIVIFVVYFFYASYQANKGYNEMRKEQEEFKNRVRKHFRGNR